MERKSTTAHCGLRIIFLLALSVASCGKVTSGPHLAAPIAHADLVRPPITSPGFPTSQPPPPGGGSNNDPKTPPVVTPKQVTFTVTEEYAYDTTCVANVKTQCTITTEIELNTSTVASCVKDPQSFAATICMPAEFKNRILASSGARVFVARLAADATHPTEWFQVMLRLSQDTQKIEEFTTLDENTFNAINGGPAIEVGRL